MHDRGVSVRQVAKSLRQDLSFSIVASPLIFISPCFAVFLAKIFTLSVTINCPENNARHTASSERYHKWFLRPSWPGSNADITIRSIDSYFRMSIQRDRFYPRAPTARAWVGSMSIPLYKGHQTVQNR